MCTEGLFALQNRVARLKVSDAIATTISRSRHRRPSNLKCLELSMDLWKKILPRLYNSHDCQPIVDAMTFVLVVVELQGTVELHGALVPLVTAPLRSQD